MDSDTYIRMVDLMGGVGMPMGQGEAYTAIQQKVIEGGENSERVYVDFKHYEVSPYFSYTGHPVYLSGYGTVSTAVPASFGGNCTEMTKEIYDRVTEIRRRGEE